MNSNYRRALFTLFYQLERDLVQMRRALALPASGTLFAESAPPDGDAAVRAINACIDRIDGYASELAFGAEPVSLAWQARAQLLADEIAIDEMNPSRAGKAFGGVGDAAEQQQARAMLAALSASLDAIRTALG